MSAKPRNPKLAGPAPTPEAATSPHPELHALGATAPLAAVREFLRGFAAAQAEQVEYASLLLRHGGDDRPTTHIALIQPPPLSGTLEVADLRVFGLGLTPEQLQHVVAGHAIAAAARAGGDPGVATLTLRKGAKKCAVYQVEPYAPDAE